VKEGGLRIGVADNFASSKHAQLVREGVRDGERLEPGEKKPLRDGALLEEQRRKRRSA
jgi:hypothetical protein